MPKYEISGWITSDGKKWTKGEWIATRKETSFDIKNLSLLPLYMEFNRDSEIVTWRDSNGHLKWAHKSHWTDKQYLVAIATLREISLFRENWGLFDEMWLYGEPRGDWHKSDPIKRGDTLILI